MKYRILGRVSLYQPEEVDIGGVKHRALLASLLLSANGFQSINGITESLWDCVPPKSSHNLIRLYVHQLRRRMGASGADLLTYPGGYTLRVAPGELDLQVFERETGQARALMDGGDYESAAARFSSALALWREPFAFSTGSPSLDRSHGPLLEDMAISAVEGHAETLLVLGRWLPLTTQLRPLVERFPFRERLLGQYMLALHWSGRRVEALEAFQRLRSSLVSELGIEPSGELCALRQHILCDDGGPAVGSGQPRRLTRRRIPITASS